MPGVSFRKGMSFDLLPSLGRILALVGGARASIVPVPVPRGPGLASCATAIAAAVVADAQAREQRVEARQRRSEEAWRAALGRPLSVARVDPPNLGRRSPAE
jgi:hypothetical protein